MLGRKNSLAGRDRELPVQEELDAHTFPTNVGVVGDAWGILAPTNSFALLSTRPFKKKPLPRPSNLGTKNTPKTRPWYTLSKKKKSSTPPKMNPKIEKKIRDFFFEKKIDFFKTFFLC